jgi:hypothetical protein
MSEDERLGLCFKYFAQRSGLLNSYFTLAAYRT